MSTLTTSEPAEFWIAQVAETLSSPAFAASVVLAIDPADGSFVAATTSAQRLVDEVGARSVADLADLGIVAKPDLRRFRDRIERWLGTLPSIQHRETAEAWHDEVRLHLAEGPERFRVDVVGHHRARYGHQLVFVTLAPFEPATASASEAASSALWTLTDLDARIVALDPGWKVLWPEPELLVGTLTSLLTHPEDMAEVFPIAHELYNAQRSACSYTVRVRDHLGRWIPVHVELRVLVSRGERFVVSSNRIVDQRRAMIPDGLLSSRELAVVFALFEGLRVTQIAARDEVSTNTVRNQLSSVYRKLGVTGQADLLSRFSRPVERPGLDRR